MKKVAKTQKNGREWTRRRRRGERRRRENDIDDYQRGKEVEVKEVEKDVDRHRERETLRESREKDTSQRVYHASLLSNK